MFSASTNCIKFGASPTFIAFLTAVSADLFQQTYAQEVRRCTEGFLKSTEATAFSSVFPCMYVVYRTSYGA